MKPRASTDLRPPPRHAAYNKAIGLVLQGGGALGSYQAGVYEALASSEYAPDWVAGISIGAINAAIIAGNEPEHRVARLRDFWESITATTRFWPTVQGETGVMWQQGASAFTTMMFGQPGFFSPRLPAEWLTPETMVSYYDTSALKTTLEKLIDFDRINRDAGPRLSIGAVNIRTGTFDYFDSTIGNVMITAEHVMASGALPPGFPPVRIGDEYYWDGGLYSNTPLQYVIDAEPRQSRLTFQVDLFASYGQLPKNIDEVNEREKDIRYSSRTRAVTESLAQKHDVRHAINEVYKLLSPEIINSAAGQKLYEYGCVTEMDIAQLIYRPMGPQGAAKDFEFSRPTMEARWQEGLSDMRTTLAVSPWLAPIPKDAGVRVFDVIHDILVAEQARAEQEAKKA
jgi:NTE family protein